LTACRVRERRGCIRSGRPQSGRGSADLRTTNRPDGSLENHSRLKAKKNQESVILFSSPKRQSDYYRNGSPERASPAIAMPILIGAAMIATAILLSTLITAVGTRFVGMEAQSEEAVWLIDRLTGSVFKCRAPARGKANCESEMATGSIGEAPKQ
jgi:hypothetical protein